MTQLLHYAIVLNKDEYYNQPVRRKANLCKKWAMQFRLLHFRKMFGLTQTEVAERLGISQGLYNQLESGKRRMNETYLSDLAKLYGISPVQLIVDDVRDDPLFDELDQAYRQLSRAERQILVDSARGIAAGRERT